METKNYKPFIIGEIASAHEGDYKKAIKIGKAALKAGANAIKFQIFKSNLLLSIKNPLYKKFQKLEISNNNWKKVVKEFRKKFFLIAEIFDFESLKFAHSLNAFKIFKLPSSCLTEIEMLQYLGKLKKPVILASGGATISEIHYALKYLNLPKNKIIIMAGFQNFPTKIESTKLSQLKLIKQKFKTNLGYADHTDSNNNFFSYSIPLMAYALGANMIEKHITLDRSKKGTDYQSSLNPDEFKKFVDRFQVSSKVFSNNSWGLTKAENNYRKFNKKFAVSKYDLNKKKKIKLSDIEFKRTNKAGITKNFIKKILGRRLRKNKLKDQIILEKDFH